MVYFSIHLGAYDWSLTLLNYTVTSKSLNLYFKLLCVYTCKQIFSEFRNCIVELQLLHFMTSVYNLSFVLFYFPQKRKNTHEKESMIEKQYKYVRCFFPLNLVSWEMKDEGLFVQVVTNRQTLIFHFAQKLYPVLHYFFAQHAPSTLNTLICSACSWDVAMFTRSTIGIIAANVGVDVSDKHILCS